jgi:hypothetical protein
MEFTTQFQRKSDCRILSEPGSGMKPTFKMHVDENGKRELRKNGEYNLYAEIQSYKDSVSIDYILARFMNGDDSALSRAQGIYGDFSEMPTTLAELQQRVIDAEDLFNSLPIDIRAQYNHSASEFFAQLDSEKTRNIFNPKTDDVVVTPSVDVQPVTPSVEPKGDVTNA